MAESRDIIISAFASTGKHVTLADGTKLALQTFSQPLDVFTEAPILLGVDASLEPGEVFYDKAFSRELARYRDATGAILPGFLRTHLAGVKVRRIALIGFSAGGGFVRGVLGSPDAAYIDTAIFLDAIHISRAYEGGPPLPQSLSPVVNFGVRAASAPGEWQGPMMVQAHTHIATPHPSVLSTSESAAAISAAVLPNAPGAPRAGYDPGLLLGGPPPPAISLGPSTGFPPPEKVFEQMVQPTGPAVGNYYVMDFGGTVAADHGFMAWFVQPGIWRGLLAPRWNAGLDCAPAGGLGQEFCGPGGVIVPDGVYTVPEGANWPAALAGLALGTAIGFAAGKAVGR